MKQDGEWDFVRPTRMSPVAEAGLSAIRISLLFGSAAIALALIAAPVLDRSTRPQLAQGFFGDGLDLTSTGSVRQAGGKVDNRYTIHRSVLQSSPNAVCVIRDNGSRSGDC